jgi:hypothetical protein
VEKLQKFSEPQNQLYKGPNTFSDPNFEGESKKFLEFVRKQIIDKSNFVTID